MTSRDALNTQRDPQSISVDVPEPSPGLPVAQKQLKNNVFSMISCFAKGAQIGPENLLRAPQSIPWSISGFPWTPQRMPRGSPEHPPGRPKAPRERPESTPRLPRSALRPANAIPRGSRDAPEGPRGSPRAPESAPEPCQGALRDPKTYPRINSAARKARASLMEYVQPGNLSPNNQTPSN